MPAGRPTTAQALKRKADEDHQRRAFAAYFQPGRTSAAANGTEGTADSTPAAASEPTAVSSLLAALDQEDADYDDSDGYLTPGEEEEEIDDDEQSTDGEAADCRLPQQSPHFAAYFQQLVAIIKQRDEKDVQAQHFWIRDLLRQGFATVPKPSAVAKLENGWKETDGDVMSDLYLPEVYIWVPPMAKKFDVKCFQTDGCPGAMVLKGPYDNPPARRVIGMRESIYLLGWRIKCNVCTKSCSTANKNYISSLPYHVSSQMTFHLTHRSGVTQDIVDLTRHLFPSGFGPSRLADMIRANHAAEHQKMALLVASMEKYRRDQCCMLNRPVLQVSAFDDKAGYNGYVPSAAYLTNVFNEIMEGVLPLVEKYMSLIPVDVLKADHSFKVLFIFTHYNQSYGLTQWSIDCQSISSSRRSALFFCGLHSHQWKRVHQGHESRAE